MFGIEFYPTPKELLDKITAGMDWKYVYSILEPSAGKGDIADYVKKKWKDEHWRTVKEPDIDCIEIDPELRHILKGKEYHVVHNDFLTFRTYKKYDLIIMNPPFSNGASHLAKALEMQKNGGSVICILNAETVKNPYTNERKALVHTLEEYNADITYMQHEFSTAERKTDVEIAVIKVSISEKENVSVFFEEMKKKHYAEARETDNNELILNDYIQAAIQQYNIELDAGISLIKEYYAMKPYILRSLDKDNEYNDCILNLSLSSGSRSSDSVSINEFVEKVRMKYWNALFRNPKFTANMTSNLVSEYLSKVDELKNYDFSLYNIKEIQMQMSNNLITGIEQCIIDLFDELSHKHSWYAECDHNIHYYNGWKTNKSWIINKKVIIPLNAFSSWSGQFNPNYDVTSKLSDIEKALNYLDGGLTENVDMFMCLRHAKETGQTKKIQLKYFTVTFYKKGTCHIEFTNLELLKKLNIFGSQKKGWLPPGYGKTSYDDMDNESQDVINEFEGKKEYEETLSNSGYYMFDAKDIPLIEG